MLRSFIFWWSIFVGVCFYVVLRSFAVDDGTWFEHFSTGLVGFVLGRVCIKYLIGV